MNLNAPVAFSEALQTARDAYGIDKPALLLGNGFSRAHSEEFNYSTLREKAQFHGLSSGLDKDALFAHAGTDDFETVIHVLEDAADLQKLYDGSDKDFEKRLRDDANVVKRGLVDTLAAIHPESAAAVDADQYAPARSFLGHFSLLFTLNYDLLLYWATNVSLTPSRGYAGPRQDGFTDFGDPARPLKWQPSDGEYAPEVFYLHGGMHIYNSGNTTRKRRSSDGALIEQVKNELGNGNYPLVVTEGTHQNKQARISQSPYLSFCHERLRNLGGALLIFGASLSHNDQHILDAISDSRIKAVFLGVLGDETRYHDVQYRAETMVHRRKSFGGGELHLHLFRADSFKVWG